MTTYFLVGVDENQNSNLTFHNKEMENSIMQWDEFFKTEFQFVPYSQSPLLNGNATTENFKQVFQAFIQSLGKDDTGVFVFCGHGHKIRGKTFLFSNETSEEFLCLNNANLNDSIIREILDNKNEEANFIMILDACYSAEDNNISPKNKNKNEIVLCAASRSPTFAKEFEGITQTQFSYYLRKVIKEDINASYYELMNQLKISYIAEGLNDKAFQIMYNVSKQLSYSIFTQTPILQNIPQDFILNNSNFRQGEYMKEYLFEKNNIFKASHQFINKLKSILS